MTAAAAVALTHRSSASDLIAARSAGLIGLGAAGILSLGRGRLQVSDRESGREGAPAWDSPSLLSPLRPLATAKAGFGPAGPKESAPGTVLGSRDAEGCRRPA